jgi:hypothetical protein
MYIYICMYVNIHILYIYYIIIYVYYIYYIIIYVYIYINNIYIYLFMYTFSSLCICLHLSFMGNYPQTINIFFSSRQDLGMSLRIGIHYVATKVSCWETARAHLGITSNRWFASGLCITDSWRQALDRQWESFGNQLAHFATPKGAVSVKWP